MTRWLSSRGGSASSGGSGRGSGAFADGGRFAADAVDGAPEGAEPAEAGASAAPDGGSTGAGPPSSIFQVGFRNLRNNHGGRRPSSTVPARISDTYAALLPLSNCDGGTKPMTIAAAEATRPTVHRVDSIGAR